MNYKIVSLSAQREQKLVWFKIISDSNRGLLQTNAINNKLNKHNADCGNLI